MRKTRARPSRAGLVAFVALCFAMLLSPARAHATHYVVDINGGADFTTIRAAIDQNFDEYRDTILVRPGDYDEALDGILARWQVYVVGVMGPLVTRTRSVAGFEGWQTRIEGLTFTDAMSIHGRGAHCYFSRCVFLGPVGAIGEAGPACIEDCDFYGRTDITQFEFGYGPPFRRLRFHGAPVHAHNGGSGSSQFEECSFEGPADTLVDVFNLDDPDVFTRCRFANARTGLLCHFEYDLGGLSVSNCSFEDLTEAGIRLAEEETSVTEAGIAIIGSRFERCGTAVRWMAPATKKFNGPYLLGDTILASIHNGVEIGRFDGVVANTIVDGSGGHGIAFFQTNADGTDNVEEGLSAYVWGSWITHNGGDGVFIENTSLPDPTRLSTNVVIECLLAQNGGAGVRVTCGRWQVSGCRAFANGGDGIVCTTTLSGLASAAYSNTSALNRGDGFRVFGPAAPGDSLSLVQHNLAVLNAGAGFRVPSQSCGSFAFNDAWNNYAGQFVGAWVSADSLLSVDPRFCDLGEGNLSLQQGSPCGAGGIYGLIGGRSEECPNVTTVAPPAPGELAFAVRPTIARGSAEFVPPSVGQDGRVEVFDLSGRRLWSAPLGPTTGTVRWRGESDAGHAKPGLFWVRFTRAGDTQSQRLVWLK
jgi:hypothetical protein